MNIIKRVLSFLPLVAFCGCDDTESVPQGKLDTGLTSGGFDAATLDAWPVLDAHGQDGEPVAMDGAVDSTPNAADGGMTDAIADGGDAGAPLNALYVHIAGKLMKADPVTAVLTEVGPTGQSYIVLAWDESAGMARAIMDVYSPVGGAAAPKLATINLCTGALTPGPSLRVGNTSVRRAEGLARNPLTGKFHITYGIAGTSAATQYLTESNGTVDVQTGEVTLIGNHQTYQDDGDLLDFVGPTLHLLDVAVGNNAGAVYAIDLATGAATKVIDVGPKVLRIANDSSRGVTFATYGDVDFKNRGLGTIDRTTGALTKIGAALPDGTYAGENFTGILVAPEPACGG